jgi:hypothetical protein
MKVLVLSVALAALAVETVAYAQAPTIDFKSRELQEGKSYTERIIAALAVGETAGSTSYSYDFQVPPGRGITPSLSLVYSSSADYSEVGHGWELTLPLIERSSEHGVPAYDAEDTFRFRNGHSAVDLVATGVTTSDGWIEYREESERSFARYLFKANAWRILRKDGTRIELGTSALTRRGRNLAAGLSGTAAWLAARIIDTHSNYALYV